MATLSKRLLCKTRSFTILQSNRVGRPCAVQWQRTFQSSSGATTSCIPDFAFAFDIDGVLVRSSSPIPGASEALSYLRQHHIPCVLLTNGGGKSETDRVEDLKSKLQVPLDSGTLIQSHTPFAEMRDLHDKTILVVGGDYDKCQRVAQEYGYKNVVTPGDIFVAYPEIWPFSKVFLDYYKGFAKPLPQRISPAGSKNSLKIDAIFVYNDPRDWALDATIILDLLLSSNGVLGTYSSKNGDKSLPNNGYQQDGQPRLYYSNPDLWWAASYHLPRLGQGGFIAAFEGLWSHATEGAKLEKQVLGKPSQSTYEFAENKLNAQRKKMLKHVGLNDPLRKVYMIGDNPESDIRGANNYQSPHGTKWTSILVKTGVYKEGTEPSCQPHVFADDVLRAVEWAIEDAKKP